MKNIIPQTPSIVSVTLLGNKARVNHSSLVDYDASAIACYLYVVPVGTSDYITNATQFELYRIDKAEVNFFDLPIPSIDSSQEYVIEMAVMDAMADGATLAGSSIKKINYKGESFGTCSNALVTSRLGTAINISDPVRVSSIRGAYLTNVLVNTPDSLSNSAPPYLVLELGADNIENTRVSSIQIEVATDYSGSLAGLTWNPIYSGNLSYNLSVSSGLQLGETYVFRVKSTFGDGSTSIEYFDSDINDRGLQLPLQEIEYSSFASAPDNLNSISFEAFTSWDGTPTYELIMSWDWAGTDIGRIRHFEIQRVRNDSINNTTNLSTLDWANAIQYSQAASTTDLTMPAIPLGNRYAFRIRAVGWGAEETRYSDWLYSKVVLLAGATGSLNFEVVPSNSTPPVSTNIQVTDQGISAYKDWGQAGQYRTFHVDAGTGNVTIGDSFIYDAVQERLQIDGEAVINDITAASVVLDWLNGVAPSIRTSTKTGYATGGAGMWAGYSSQNTFQFDLGDDSKYLRWDGNDLTISGGVTIELPDDASTLPPGSIGYTTLSLTATNNIVLFKGGDNSLRENPTIINVNASTNGNADFISNLVWQVLDGSDNDITSQVLSAQYTGAPNSAKKLTISTANGALSSYNNMVVRVYYKPNTETWATSNIKDFTNIGKVKSFDEIAGLEEPFYAYLTNDNQAIPVDGEGKNPYLADASGQFKLYQGTSDLSNSPSTSYSIVSADGCTVTLSGSTYTVTGVPLTNGVPTKDTFAITIRATYNTGEGTITYDRVFSLFVSKQGEQGIQGPEGPSGPQGVQGPAGPQGETTYTWVRYAAGIYKWSGTQAVPTNNDAGVDFNFTSNGVKDVVLKLKLTDAEGNIYVSLNGTLVGNGFTAADGVTEWFEFPMTTANGSNVLKIYNPTGVSADGCTVREILVIGNTTNDPTDQEFIGLAYNKTTPVENPNIYNYSWSKLRGEDGVEGPQGPDGDTLYTWIKYSPNSNGSSMTNSPQADTAYIGLAYNKATATESNNPSDYTWSRFKGETGNDGGTGQRAPGWYEASTTQNPLNSSVWSGGTNSHAYDKLEDLVGPVFAYDTLTLYNSSNPSLTDTYMWNGATWEAAVKINGNIIADGTVRARAIAADEGFFEEIQVDRIYNHGGNSGNYKMMIDFQNGAIHIRGGN